MGQHGVTDEVQESEVPVEARYIEYVDQNTLTRIVYTPPADMSNADFSMLAQTISPIAQPGSLGIGGADLVGHQNLATDFLATSSGQNSNFVGEPLQLTSSDLSSWGAYADASFNIDPLRSNSFSTSVGGLEGSSGAAAAGAAAASRRFFYETENAKIDAEYLKGASQRSQESFDRQSGYYAEQDSLSLEQFAQRQAYNAESAALDIRGATGQASYNQSQLDRSLEGIGLGAMDYRRGESLAADPYRALEADQTGVASGQRRYAQDVRLAAAASEEKKIALAEQKVADAKAESDRALGLAVQGIQSAQRNTASSNATSFAIAESERAERAAIRAETREETEAGNLRSDTSGITMSEANNTMFISSDGTVYDNRLQSPLSSDPEDATLDLVATGLGIDNNTPDTPATHNKYGVSLSNIRNISSKPAPIRTPEEVAAANNQFMWG